MVTLAVAAVLYAAILAVRLLDPHPSDAPSLLYVFPVSLVAVAFGPRAGISAGLVAVALVVVSVVVDDVSLTAAGWASRIVPLVILGALLGDASERVRRAEAEKQRLEAAALLYREAIEINDTLVQGMVASRWALEAGRQDAGLQTLEQTIGQAQELVSGLIRRAGTDSPDPSHSWSPLRTSPVEGGGAGLPTRSDGGGAS
jgi:hypothetical protein